MKLILKYLDDSKSSNELPTYRISVFGIFEFFKDLFNKLDLIRIRFDEFELFSSISRSSINKILKKYLKSFSL